LAYAAAGGVYHFGSFWPQFSYEFSKDAFGYLLMIAAFAINEHVFGLIARSKASGEAMFAIRDGTRIVRVAFADIIAVTSAGNYVEFVLRDGRRPLMRSPLSQIETEFASRGFVRVHRSWLVNRAALTGLRPDGSGDYTVEIGELTVPLSRRFPEALASLKSS
jgi:DNA-binding LytR/AlgR family response regulator